MSVKEARKLLGKKYDNLTDEQVAELVEQTHKLAKLALDVARDARTRENHDKSERTLRSATKNKEAKD